MGTKFLLTYSIGPGDIIYALSSRFNVSVTRIAEANGLSDEFTAIYPFTTILIPLPSEPSSSHTVIRGYNLKTSPLPAPLGRKSRSNRVLLAAGIAAGVLLLMIVLILVLVFRLHEKRQEVPHSPRDLILEIARFDRALRVFNFSEIKKATGNFGSRSRMTGCVYRGTFRREVLAVKKKNRNAGNEVKMLVYEYMKNGSLQEWFGTKGSEGQKSWNERIRIALDVANGLLYLHNFTNPAHVHNNISSSSIFLDGSLRAKIANFSLARTTNCSSVTRIVGTKGYIAPECLDAGPVTPKVDVFAFGVVLLEFVAPGLGENGGLEHAIQVAKLSLSCLRQDPEDRPAMVEVVSVLLKVQLSIHKRAREIGTKMALSMDDDQI